MGPPPPLTYLEPACPFVHPCGSDLKGSFMLAGSLKRTHLLVQLVHHPDGHQHSWNNSYPGGGGAHWEVNPTAAGVCTHSPAPAVGVEADSLPLPAVTKFHKL